MSTMRPAASARETTPPAGETYRDYVDAPGTDYVAPVISVRVVEQVATEARAARSWSTGTTTSPADGAVQVIGPHPARSRVLIVNTSEDTPVYLGAAVQTAAPAGGFCLLPGASVELLHREAVYVTGDATVSYLAEYLDG